MLTAVLFDLDGTLLPMDQEVFVNAYVGGMAKKLVPHGYQPEKMVRSVWKATGALAVNDGSMMNEELFWKVFNASMERDCRQDEPVFQEYYETDFQKVKDVCGQNPLSLETVRTLREMGLRVILATNPMFPPIATRSRVRWAGLEPEDFEWITTYDNSSYCKPNPDYYREILGKLNLQPETCLMVGNDALEDMVAEEVGLKVFLLTDCLINRDGRDISRYPQGSFPELMEYIRSMV